MNEKEIKNKILELCEILDVLLVSAATCECDTESILGFFEDISIVGGKIRKLQDELQAATGVALAHQELVLKITMPDDGARE